MELLFLTLFFSKPGPIHCVLNHTLLIREIPYHTRTTLNTPPCFGPLQRPLEEKVGQQGIEFEYQNMGISALCPLLATKVEYNVGLLVKLLVKVFVSVCSFSFYLYLVFGFVFKVTAASAVRFHLQCFFLEELA